MAGRGEIEDIDRETNPRVFTLSKDDQWMPAAEPIHFDKKIAGVGPGLAFGKAMAKEKPGVRIGLIPCAVGGSPISTWEPGKTYEGTHTNPYDDAIRRARKAQESGVLKGILWHQGESDSKEGQVELYQQRLKELIERLRHDLQTPNVPFVAGELGEFYVQKNPLAAKVNAVLAKLPDSEQNTAFVRSNGLKDKGDKTHFDAASARELGRRYAKAVLRLENQERME